MAKPFLTARWENLVLLNYRCPSDLLAPLVPDGTELDSWGGEHLISLVGFEFLGTRILGIPIFGHRSFVEVNLRFYVRRDVGVGVRRGVVFIRELVPKPLIAASARVLYGEPYRAVPMTRSVSLTETSGGSVRYSWVDRGATHSLTASAAGPAAPLVPGSEAEFITEHYWGYNGRPGGRTLEYRVDHPRWLVWECDEATYDRPTSSQFYGSGFDDVLFEEPVSAFLATGSTVAVYRGSRLAAR